ncbi:transposase [Sphaerisporangium sp. NPDC049003]|uniref:transposase n=1 Tax=Sphaerisporangium sp. NPDC049003 TaxID=3364517 RepID=UPI003721F397
MKVYSAEFKADAVTLYLSDPARTVASVARDLGVSRETLRLWVRQAQAAGTAPEKAGPTTKPAHAPITSDDVSESPPGSPTSTTPAAGTAPPTGYPTIDYEERIMTARAATGATSQDAIAA